MDRLLRQIDEFFRRPIGAIILAVATIVGTAIALLELFKIGVTSLKSWSPWVAGLLFVISLIVIYRRHDENVRLKQVFSELHQINHLYRNALFEFFKAPQLSEEGIVNREKEVLNAVTGKIANLFSTLTRRKIVAVVSLVVIQNEEQYVFDFVESDPDVTRPDRPRYKVDEKNTRFHRATIEVPDHQCPVHFFCRNLDDAKGKREFFDPSDCLAKSSLVVPIRYFKEGNPPTKDYFGFLRLDSHAAYCLNDDFHLQCLAALADQMYNFLSLMRGKYVKANDKK